MPVSAPPTDWKSARWWQNRSLEERLAWAHFPRRWESATLDHTLMSERTGKRTATFLNDHHNGMFIYGPSGSGKTPLAISIARELLTTQRLSARFITAERYVDMLKDEFDNDNQLPEMYSLPYLVKYIKGVFDIVILDAVGEERSTDFSKHEVGSLLRRRHEDQRCTIVTTAMTPADFVRRYGKRVSTPVAEMLQCQVQ